MKIDWNEYGNPTITAEHDREACAEEVSRGGYRREALPATLPRRDPHRLSAAVLRRHPGRRPRLVQLAPS